MQSQQLIPVVRDVVFLVVGAGTFIWGFLHDARLDFMLLATAMALGPSFMAAYWSARIHGNGSRKQSDSPSSSPQPLPSISGDEP